MTQRTALIQDADNLPGTDVLLAHKLVSASYLIPYGSKYVNNACYGASSM